MPECKPIQTFRITNTCVRATSKIPAYQESAPLKTPISIKIGKFKFLKFVGEIFAKAKTCQSCLLVPIQINTTAIIVRDILIDTLLFDQCVPKVACRQLYWTECDMHSLCKWELPVKGCQSNYQGETREVKLCCLQSIMLLKRRQKEGTQLKKIKQEESEVVV